MNFLLNTSFNKKKTQYTANIQKKNDIGALFYPITKKILLKRRPMQKGEKAIMMNSQ
jgi:hypothetical protein